MKQFFEILGDLVGVVCLFGMFYILSLYGHALGVQ